GGRLSADSANPGPESGPFRAWPRSVEAAGVDEIAVNRRPVSIPEKPRPAELAAPGPAELAAPGAADSAPAFSSPSQAKGRGAFGSAGFGGSRHGGPLPTSGIRVLS